MMNISCNEFHLRREIRDICGFSGTLFSSTGNVLFSDMQQVRQFAEKFNTLFDKRGQSEKRISAGQLNAMGLIDEIFHYVCMTYRKEAAPLSMSNALATLDRFFGNEKTEELLNQFNNEFPPAAVYEGALTTQQYLAQSGIDPANGSIRSNRESTLEEMILLHLANENPAFKPFSELFNDSRLRENPFYTESWKALQSYFKTCPAFGPFSHELITLLREPVVFSPESLKGQLDYIYIHWKMIPAAWQKRLLSGMDTISEEEKAAWSPAPSKGPEMSPYNYDSLQHEYERFSPDRDWMPKVVLLAKTVLVWLDQLSKKYKRSIQHLDQIPDEELDTLAKEGFTALWLIGLWERSYASRRIKQLCGNPEAAASAYSLYDYEIADSLGGWTALDNLRRRLWQRGIRLASDMVPNHTGIDSRWVMEKPDLFIQRKDCPFPQYTFNGENLSQDSRTGIYLEDHYYSKNDCAVVFKRVDKATGDVRYIYHGNDGTGLPWNDTAQIDFLNPEAREAVIQEILHVAKNFPVIRFDAAMVLAKKHIRRLWYPEPGHGGDIATRGETGLSSEQFDQAIPVEFWREVVDRIAKEVPDTLLLAEAFWMMEGYFVRTLGMHRVYNSAFMNMLKQEDNKKYRDTIKNTLAFDPQVLKRFVNFMNNPDEETAVAQFGKEGKYFGVCTLMVTMPGLPMFGHGQIEGFEEKYGMEYTKAYRNETADNELIKRHWQDIFPLMKKRYLFAGVENFLFYDVWSDGKIEENIFAYSNSTGEEYAVVFYNNRYERSCGWIKQSVPYAVKVGTGEKDMEMRTCSISEGLGLTAESDRYCIFREHHNGLWYIRSCSELCTNGMFVCLNGFEYQVLMNFRQIPDTPEGKYRILCTTLAGRGTEDLEIAWDEIRYKELYDVFLKFVSNRFVAQVQLLLLQQRVSVTSVRKFLRETEPEAIAFYKTAIVYAGLKKITAESCFAKFCRAFRKLARIKGNYAFTGKSGALGDMAAFFNKTDAAGIPVYSMMICYAAVNVFADRGFALRWSLERKFTTVFQTGGIAFPDMPPAFVRLFTLAMVSGRSLYDIVKELFQGQKTALLCGTNTFADVRWFNKELSDSSLAYLTAIRLLRASPERRGKILQKYRELTTAKEKAGYNCDLLVASFTPAKKRGQGKKNTGKPL